MILHSDRPELAATGGAAFPDTIVLHCGQDESPLCIAPASGMTYRIVARDASTCSRLVQQTLCNPHAELLPHSGGLLSNLSVLENVVLPAVYHGRVATTQLAERVYDEFAACGLARSEAERFCTKAVSELSEFERRLAALVRSLIMRPAVLVMERIFEGLTIRDMEQVRRFGEYYRCGVADGTLIVFDLAGISSPDIVYDVQTEAQ